MKYILSTATQTIAFQLYKIIGDLPVAYKRVTVRGGAHLPSRRSGFGEMTADDDGAPIWTAEGMITPVSDENFEILKEHWLFKKMIDRGTIKVINHDITGNHKEVQKEVRTMRARDEHSQLTPGTADKRIKVTTKLVEQEQGFRI